MILDETLSDDLFEDEFYEFYDDLDSYDMIKEVSYDLGINEKKINKYEE